MGGIAIGKCILIGEMCHVKRIPITKYFFVRRATWHFGSILGDLVIGDYLYLQRSVCGTGGTVWFVSRISRIYVR